MPQDKQSRDSPLPPEGELESPFLDEEFFVRGAEPEMKGRLEALINESPFAGAFEGAPKVVVKPELYEEKTSEEGEEVLEEGFPDYLVESEEEPLETKASYDEGEPSVNEEEERPFKSDNEGWFEHPHLPENLEPAKQSEGSFEHMPEKYSWNVVEPELSQRNFREEREVKLEESLANYSGEPIEEVIYHQAEDLYVEEEPILEQAENGYNQSPYNEQSELQADLTYEELDSFDQPEIEEIEAEAFEDSFPEALTVTEVFFPSGESLPVILGPVSEEEDHYDPNNSNNPLLDTSSANRTKRLSKDFTVRELARSGNQTFDKARIDPKLVKCLQAIRDNIGKPVIVTSGYRSCAYNKKIKGASKSQHMSGRAADIKVAGMSGQEIAERAINACRGDVSIGIGTNFAHVDVRGKPVRWVQRQQKGDQPAKILFLKESNEIEYFNNELFNKIEFMDLDEWISVTHYVDDIVNSATNSLEETPILDLAPFTEAKRVLTDLSLMRSISHPPTNIPNYEFKFKARIYYPRGKRPKELAGTKIFPIVVMIHGMHGAMTSSGSEFHSHLGFEYLQKELARRGIVSMSISTNPANILNSHFRTRAEFVLAGLRLLQQLNTPNKHPYEHRFENRLDLHNIGLMGHSMGGDAVVKAVMLLRGDSNFKVKAVCSIAPTDFTGTVSNQLKLKASDKLRFLVLYGSHDGDVAGNSADTGSGFRHYDRATCDRTMVFVKGITHNRFNANWKDYRHYGDWQHCFVANPACESTPPGPGCPPFDSDIRSAMDHWQLAIDYIGGLFRLELNGETSRTGLFNGLIIPRGNHNVSIQWSFGKILEIENFEDPTHNALGGTATYTNTSRVEFTGVVTGPPNVPHQTWAMKADIEGGTYRADIPQANRDFSQFKLLTFRMTSEFDTTSRDTIRDGRLPKFIVRFWFGKPDGSSGFAEVDQRSLDLRGVRERNRPFFHRICIPQGIGGHTIGILAVNVTKIVFDTLAIPLTRFAGVNWHNIQAVEFVAGLGIEKKLGVPAKSQATNIVPIYVASIAVSQA